VIVIDFTRVGLTWICSCPTWRAYDASSTAKAQAWAWQIIGTGRPATWCLYMPKPRHLLLTNESIKAGVATPYLSLADKMPPVTAHDTLGTYMHMMESSND